MTKPSRRTYRFIPTLKKYCVLVAATERSEVDGFTPRFFEDLYQLRKFQTSFAA